MGTVKAQNILREATRTLRERAPGMSVRAVAGRLGVSPSYWSKILRGDKPLSTTLFPRVIQVLGLDAQQSLTLQKSLLAQVEDDLVPATGVRTQKNDSPVENFRLLGATDFWLLEEWFYIPLLNLFTVDGFSGGAEDAAARLGLNMAQTREALARLTARGFLQSDGDKLVRSELHARFPLDRSFAAVRAHHGAMIKKAGQELLKESSDYDARLISSVNFAGSREKIREARLILEEALFKAASLMAEGPVTDEVYQLNVQLFPLTKSKS